MTRASDSILDADDPLPALSLTTLSHGPLTLPSAWSGRYGVLLLYRAHW